jgi:DNA-binding CsgD family transcriptional regulator/F0F1-type ATP synthase assembly protein I
MYQFNGLTKREGEVVKLLLQGKSNKLMAASLGISDRTVEFHLKNIYAKYQVSSRIELVLKLGNATGQMEIQKLGYSTVVNPGESAENRDTPNPRTARAPSFRDTVSKIGKELEMKNLLNSKHVAVGVITALITGFVWLALLKRFGHVSLNSIEPWILPLVIILTIIGLCVGLVGKRNGNTPLKVWFSTLLSTGLGAFAMLPLVVIIVLPLGKLAEWVGLVDRSTISSGVASTLVTSAMLIMWLIVGTLIGSMLSFVTIKKTKQVEIQRQAPEHGL